MAASNMSALLYALLASVLWGQVSVAVRPLKRSTAEPSRTCLQVADLWGNLTRAHQGSLFQLPPRQASREMAELYNRAVCFPYQLMDSLIWLRSTSPDWVSPAYRDAYQAVMTRASSEHGNIGPAGLRCRCTDPITSAPQLSRDTLMAMLYSILVDEKALDLATKSAQRLIDAIGPTGIVVVGNSAVFEKYPVPTGPLIDNFTTVIRFNTEWIASKAHLVGHKRDVWFAGDYKSACGCPNPRCCNAEETEQMWERIGPAVKIYIGTPPPGANSPSHAHTRFEKEFGISLAAITYWLWLRSRENPEINSPYHPRGRPLRTGFKAVLKVLIGGAVTPTLAGFDVGDAHMYTNYFEAVKHPDSEAVLRRNSVGPQRYHVAEAKILGDLHRVGMVRNLMDLVHV